LTPHNEGEVCWAGVCVGNVDMADCRQALDETALQEAPCAIAVLFRQGVKTQASAARAKTCTTATGCRSVVLSHTMPKQLLFCLRDKQEILFAY